MAFRNSIETSEERHGVVSHPNFSLHLLLTYALITAGALLLVALAARARASESGSKPANPDAASDMVLIPEGEFVMGNEGAYADETPRHSVKMPAFYLDAHEVTNEQFTVFVQATGYVTSAERDEHCWAYFQGDTDWQYAQGTNWRHPQGPHSTIDDKMNHPVVCVTWDDAAAFAKWAGKRLPSEAEWEYAARAGSQVHFVARTNGNRDAHSHHAGGAHAMTVSDRSPSSKSHAGGSHHQIPVSGSDESVIDANVWEGHWPEHNELTDGFYYTAPVESFAANNFNVSDMLGNVWEWTADWYDSSYYAVSPAVNPQGPAGGKNRVARGGSWFCSPNYCGAYSTHYRGASPPDHAFNNVGFRCAKDAAPVKNFGGK